MTTAESYRDRLRAELHRRQMINPRYSMRGFAKAIGLSAPFLSKVLSGQKNLSLTSAAEICGILEFSQLQATEFCRLVQVESTPSAKARGILMENRQETLDEAVLELEAFSVVSDWYHYAILELSTCRGFKPDPTYIANKLRISKGEAASAVRRLTTLGLLKLERGRITKTDKIIATRSDQPSRALKNFHSQMISKAAAALEEQPVEEREITGATLAISKAQIPHAKAEIRKFLLRLIKTLDTETADQVVQLNVQLFALSDATDKVGK